MNTIDLRTQVEKDREQKHKTICSMYVELTKKQPNATPYRLFGAIAKAVGMTAAGVKNIIARAGLYSTRK